MRRTALCALLFSASILPAVATAADPLLDRNLISLGGGLSLNSIDGPLDDELGYQFLVGYDLKQVSLLQGVDTSIEIGYMDYGFNGADSNGLWINAVVDGDINSGLGWLARAGLDLGDDGGIMIGGGLSVPLEGNNTLRFEYVVRDEVDSLQLNFVHHL